MVVILAAHGMVHLPSLLEGSGYFVLFTCFQKDGAGPQPGNARADADRAVPTWFPYAFAPPW